MEALRSLARAEDKLLLVHFDASWCQPCHWMERHAFADEALATFVHEHFVPVVLRADEKQTAELCRRYEVELLPTLLVLDPEGNLIGKYEETQNAASLMMELRVLLRKREAPSRPYVFQNPRLMEPTARPEEREEYLAVAAEAPPAQATPPKPTLPLLVAETSRLQPVSHYSIQLGVFSDYANAAHFAGSLDGDRFSVGCGQPGPLPGSIRSFRFRGGSPAPAEALPKRAWERPDTSGPKILSPPHTPPQPLSLGHVAIAFSKHQRAGGYLSKGHSLRAGASNERPPVAHQRLSAGRR